MSQPAWQSIPAYLAGQEDDLPPCENCGRKVDDDGEPVHRDDADWCSDCTMALGMQHHALFVDRDKWWARGGHCLCDECAPPRPTLTDPCRLCGETDAHPDSVNGLCGQCATDMAADLAEMAGEDRRVGLCCSNAPDCGGLCPGGSH